MLKTVLDTMSRTIADAERARELDWRSSYSSVRLSEHGHVVVELSREEVRADLLASLGEPVRADAPHGDVTVERAGGVEVLIRLLRPAPAEVLWVTTSVADIRRHPAHEAELVNQGIMGETAERLTGEGEWMLARLTDGYHGWIRSWCVAAADRTVIEEYESRVNARVRAPIGYILSEPRDGAIPVSDIVAGCRIVAGDTVDGFREVSLPLERKGFIKKNDLEELQYRAPDRDRIVKTAHRFIGIPYQWGGTSAKAFDCSGLVKRVYQLEGLELPRDSDLQARAGSPVPREEAVAARAGDLLFFGEGETVKHVAVGIGNGRFIHAYGCVRINSLREEDTLYDRSLAQSLLYARSVLDGP